MAEFLLMTTIYEIYTVPYDMLWLNVLFGSYIDFEGTNITVNYNSEVIFIFIRLCKKPLTRHGKEEHV